MRKLALLPLLLLTGCLPATGGDAARGESGASASTVYNSHGTIAYFDNSGTTVFKTAYFNLGLEKFSIGGSTYSLVRYGAACTSTEAGTISFDTGNFQYTINNRTVSNVPAGPCTVAYNLTAGQTGDFSPSSWNISVPSGALAPYTGPAFVKSDRIGLGNSETSASGHFVYYVFLKQ